MFNRILSLLSRLNFKRFCSQALELYNYSWKKMQYPILMVKYYFIDIVSQIFPRIKKTEYLDKTYRSLNNKASVFYTPFWNFLFKTANLFMITKEYEATVRKVILNNFQKNKEKKEKIFLNIGANIGRWWIELSKNMNYKSHMFEPTPETYRFLKINTILSEVENKTYLYNFALWDKEDTLKFQIFTAHNGGNRIYQDNLVNDFPSEYIEVPVKKFDDISWNIATEEVALILIDVEWFELQVLSGMTNFLKKLNSVDLVVEIWPSSPNKEKIFELMKSLGFSHSQIDSDNFLFQK